MLLDRFCGYVSFQFCINGLTFLTIWVFLPIMPFIIIEIERQLLLVTDIKNIAQVRLLIVLACMDVRTLIHDKGRGSVLPCNML